MRLWTAIIASVTSLALTLSTPAIMLLAALALLIGTGWIALQDSRRAK